MIEIAEDLVALAMGAGPIEIGGEGEAVEVGLHIAGCARIAVRPPDAPGSCGPLDDHEIRDASFLEPNRHADPAEPGAHDQNRFYCIWRRQERSPLLPLMMDHRSGLSIAPQGAKVGHGAANRRRVDLVLWGRWASLGPSARGRRQVASGEAWARRRCIKSGSGH